MPSPFDDENHPRNWVDLPAQRAAARILDEEAIARGWWTPEMSTELPKVGGVEDWRRSIEYCEFLDVVSRITLTYKISKRAARADPRVNPAEDAALVLQGEVITNRWGEGGFSLDGLPPEERAAVVAFVERMGETYLAECSRLADEIRGMARIFVLDKVRIDSLAVANPKAIKGWAESFRFWSTAAPAHYREAWGFIAGYAEAVAKGDKPYREKASKDDPTGDKLFRETYLFLVPGELKATAELVG